MIVLEEQDRHEKELDSHISSVKAALEQRMEDLKEAHREELNIKEEIISQLESSLAKLEGNVEEMKNEQDLMKAILQGAKEDFKNADLKLVKFDMVSRKDRLKAKLAVVKYDKMKQMFKDALKDKKYATEDADILAKVSDVVKEENQALKELITALRVSNKGMREAVAGCGDKCKWALGSRAGQK